MVVCGPTAAWNRELVLEAVEVSSIGHRRGSNCRRLPAGPLIVERFWDQDRAFIRVGRQITGREPGWAVGQQTPIFCSNASERLQKCDQGLFIVGEMGSGGSAIVGCPERLSPRLTRRARPSRRGGAEVPNNHERCLQFPR